MQDYKHNNSAAQHAQKKARHIVSILIVVILLIIALVSTIRLLKKKAYVHSVHNNLEREYTKLLESKKKLDMATQTLNDSEGIDRVIRNTYRAVKEGEELVVLVPDAQ